MHQCIWWYAGDACVSEGGRGRNDKTVEYTKHSEQLGTDSRTFRVFTKKERSLKRHELCSTDVKGIF